MTPSQTRNLVPGESKVLLNYTGGFKRVRKVVHVERDIHETFTGVPFCWVHIEVIREIHGRTFMEIHGVASHNIRAIY